MHPSNKYADKAPDFKLLAALYPAFQEYVTYGPNQKSRIDWTNFNATRELTRVLLRHYYGVTWWIPDGQLCPTVTNRANYIRWIENLLAFSPAPWHNSHSQQVAGIDIGTGANCIYPLLGTAIHRWRFVGTDITPVALEWAQKNVESNPHVAELIEIRCALLDADGIVNSEHTSEIGPALPPLASNTTETVEIDGEQHGAAIREPHGSPLLPKESVTGFVDIGPQGPPQLVATEIETCSNTLNPVQVPPDLTNALNSCDEPAHCKQPPSAEENVTVLGEEKSPCVLVGIVREEERFDFCMCNPPFFASMEEAGLNPRTACGGTAAEMVCQGGEEAFVARIIEDSVKLKHAIHWYTTMVGRKVTLKGLTAKLWALGATTVRTTEFVQGHTSRWGLAWSFTPRKPAPTKTPVTNKSNVSFMLGGLGRGSSAVDVLQLLASQLQSFGATCTISLPTFSISGCLPDKLRDYEVSDGISGKRKRESTGDSKPVEVAASDTRKENQCPSFRASVFQQAPGSLLIKASLINGGDRGDTFAELFKRVEQALKIQFASNQMFQVVCTHCQEFDAIKTRNGGVKCRFPIWIDAMWSAGSISKLKFVRYNWMDSILPETSMQTFNN